MCIRISIQENHPLTTRKNPLFLVYWRYMSILLTNKYLSREYETLDTFHAGIALLGGEVKTLKGKHGSINESFVVTENGELFLVKAHIPWSQPGNGDGGFDPYRKRKLLLTKKELNEIIKQKETAGLTVVPKMVSLQGRLIKVELALVRGKSKHDKREALKQRDDNREMERTLKNYR